MRVNRLPFTIGVRWIAEAFAIFRAQPGAWISLTSLWIVVSFVLMLFPLIGSAVAQMAQPAFFAGFVLACRDQRNGMPINASYLFAGFKAAGRLFLVLGAITLLAESLLILLFDQLGLFEGFRAIDTRSASIAEAARQMQQALAQQGDLVLGLLFTLFTLKAALWFSAAMIAYRPMPPMQAVKWSVLALFTNILPLTLFGVLLFGLLCAAMLPWALGLLLFFPLYAILHYVSFMATFDDSDEYSAAA